MSKKTSASVQSIRPPAVILTKVENHERGISFLRWLIAQAEAAEKSKQEAA